MTTTVDQAHTESEDYFAGHFPGEDVENYSGHNDEMDAYRHAYTSAVFAYELGIGLAGAMGTAHELRGNLNGQPHEEYFMDSFNNRVGLDVGSNIPPNTSNYKDLIAQELANRLANGDMKVNQPHFADSTDDEYSAPQEQADKANAELHKDWLDEYRPDWDRDDPHEPFGPWHDSSAPEPYGPWVPGVTTPFGEGENAASPIVLDIDASGTIELVALNGTGSVMWDIDEDGFREASGWITGGDGLLSIDLNSDGIINDHGELFGGTNGYVTLAAYDTNSSGSITSADADFGDLLVWVDSNADGFSQSGELHTLSSLGITSISTSYSTVSYAIAGNEIKYESTFVMNGNTYTSVDAFFAYDAVNTTYAGDYTLDVRTLFLPTLRGYGHLPDLHIAMSMDETLLEMVEDFTLLEPDELVADIMNSEDGALVDILYRWAGVDTVTPTSRGAYIDARVLEFLETFMGREFLQGGTNPDPGSGPAILLMESWTNAFHAFATRMAYQTGNASEWFEGSPVYDPISDTFGDSPAIDFDAIEDWFAQFEAFDEQLNAARFLATAIDEVVGIENLTTQNQTDLQGILPFGGTIETYSNTLRGTGTINGNIDDNLLLGSDSGDYLYGDEGNDILISQDGNDNLYGDENDDVLIGGAGLDYLTGGTGNDTYAFAAGDGNDYVYESAEEGTDTIRLTGYATSDVRMWTDSSGHLHIANRADAADETVVVASTTGASGTSSETAIGLYVENVLFDDTTNWSLTGGLTLEGGSSGDYLCGSQYNDTLSGMDGYDTLYGNRGNDTLIGGAGLDYLTGGTGNDTYAFAAGDGNDYVYESAEEGTDTIRLTGYATSDVRMWTDSSGHLHIANRADAADETVVVASTTGASGTSSETAIGLYVENVLFDDTTNWSLTGGLTLEGGSSGDYLYGSQYNDTLSGMDGYDTLYGNRGNDTLIGGAGLDYLTGGTGNDTYAFAAGDGNDYVYESAEEGTDTIRLTGYATSDVRMWTDSSGHLHIANRADAADETVVVASTTGASGTSSETAIGLYVENVLFDDTTNWSLTGGLTLEGGSSGDYLCGSQYNDTLSGMDGYDTLYGNRGNDTLIGGAGADYLYGSAGDDILYGGADTDIMTGDTGADEFVFENATAFGGSDTISDFSTAEVDTLNISDLLDVYDPLNDAISDFVQITDNGTHSFLSVDADGGGNSFTQIAQLSAVTNIAAGATATETELQAMITAGTLLVA